MYPLVIFDGCSIANCQPLPDGIQFSVNATAETDSTQPEGIGIDILGDLIPIK